MKKTISLFAVFIISFYGAVARNPGREHISGFLATVQCQDGSRFIGWLGTMDDSSLYLSDQFLVFQDSAMPVQNFRRVSYQALRYVHIQKTTHPLKKSTGTLPDGVFDGIVSLLGSPVDPGTRMRGAEAFVIAATISTTLLNGLLLADSNTFPVNGELFLFEKLKTFVFEQEKPGCVVCSRSL